MREFKEQVGFLTIAQNNQNTDYLTMAYQQAVNIKTTQPWAKYAVIVDTNTEKLIQQCHLDAIDYVIILPEDAAVDEQWKMSNEWKVFSLTPFKETIKLESDLLLTRDISHWLHALRFKDICFSLDCRNYLGETIKHTRYRKLFELNELPNIYTGLYYFRFSQTASNFFKLAQSIYQNWALVQTQLTQCNEQVSTDLAMSLAAKLFGLDLCTIPSLDYWKFTHMKPSVQGWSDNQSWLDTVNVEIDQTMIRINNQNQYYPIHYYDKSFPSRAGIS